VTQQLQDTAVLLRLHSDEKQRKALEAAALQLLRSHVCGEDVDLDDGELQAY